jgi:general secretion pathway protein C
MSALSLQQADLVRVMQGRNTQRVILVVNLLLVVWIASKLATLTWSFLAPEESPQPVAAVTTTAPVKASPDAQLIRQLPGWHLMGVVTQEQAPVKTAAPIDAPDTRLKLVLRGALSSDDQEQARAIIADPRGQEEHYAIGDTLPGNAELSKIYPDRVILQRNGRYETLRLPEDGASKGRSGNTVASRANTRRNITPSSASPAERLKNMRKQLKQSPRSLYGLVRATPKQSDDGKMIGYTVSPGRDPELFSQVGLQAGDVVVRVNDIALNNAANSARALKSAQAGKTVSMTVLRDGQEQVLSVSVPEQ